MIWKANLNFIYKKDTDSKCDLMKILVENLKLYYETQDWN